ncbi:GntR family transcriptional regulator [Lactobacillus hamsteri]|uniref:Transcriptional regulator n=1 Tax=Lactobacillus hamsteri DSM 5661 = JCM 6256 TaxID=1423754 RepID=A0A0R1YE12_9LACO|nr:GntR family transcriptional regulator [Lactobacillus hamsteri]KRM40704.1 transcriptional regulator [Lactobacillus hamsteri DSM 5661 = JCM 6256]
MTNQDQAYKYIKDQIIAGKYQPGHVFSENQLSIRLNMSRTPIREAFKKLENDGLIERNGQETKVTKVDSEELKENYELRSMMEGYALNKSFKNLDRNQLNSFESKFRSALDQKNWQLYLECDEKFHCYLTKSEDKVTLQKELDLLQSQTNRMRYAIRDDQRCMKSSVKEILEIISAIREDDQDQAIKKLRQHIESVYEWESSYLEQHE